MKHSTPQSVNSGDHNTVIRTTLRGQSHGVHLFLEDLAASRN